MALYHITFGQIEIVKKEICDGEEYITFKVVATGKEDELHADFFYNKVSETPFENAKTISFGTGKSKGDKKRASDKKALANIPEHVLRMEHADGTPDYAAREAFEQRQNAAKWGSKSW